MSYISLLYNNIYRCLLMLNKIIDNLDLSRNLKQITSLISSIWISFPSFSWKQFQICIYLKMRIHVNTFGLSNKMFNRLRIIDIGNCRRKANDVDLEKLGRWERCMYVFILPNRMSTRSKVVGKEKDNVIVRAVVTISKIAFA